MNISVTVQSVDTLGIGLELACNRGSGRGILLIRDKLHLHTVI